MSHGHLAPASQTRDAWIDESRDELLHLSTKQDRRRVQARRRNRPRLSSACQGQEQRPRAALATLNAGVDAL
jgi:hypothetical protein